MDGWTKPLLDTPLVCEGISENYSLVVSHQVKPFVVASGLQWRQLKRLKGRHMSRHLRPSTN